MENIRDVVYQLEFENIYLKNQIQLKLIQKLLKSNLKSQSKMIH